MFKIFKKNNPIIEQTDGEHTWKLKHIYTDKFKNKWYQLVDIDTLPSKRYAAIEVKKSFLEIGIDKYTFEAAGKTIKRLAENGDTDNIVKLWDAIVDRLSFDFNSRNILDLSCTLFTINDENIYQYSDYYDELKKDVLNKDSDARDFFLTISYELAKRFTEKYGKYDKDNLAELILREKQLNHYFGNMMHRVK